MMMASFILSLTFDVAWQRDGISQCDVDVATPLGEARPLLVLVRRILQLGLVLLGPAQTVSIIRR